MESAGLVSRGDKEEGDVLLERAAGQDVQAAQSEAGSGNLLFHRCIKGGVVDCDFVSAFPAPEGSHAQSDGPVGRVLPDRSVAIIHELVAVVLKLLAKIIQHWPGLM